ARLHKEDQGRAQQNPKVVDVGEEFHHIHHTHFLLSRFSLGAPLGWWKCTTAAPGCQRPFFTFIVNLQQIKRAKIVKNNVLHTGTAPPVRPCRTHQERRREWKVKSEE